MSTGRMTPRAPVVAIDGPAGAGKTTVARRLAGRLGWELVRTGDMYRAAALSCVRAGVGARDPEALRRHLAPLKIELAGGRVLLDGEDVTAAIRDPAITRATSDLSRLAVVRDKVMPLQRARAAAGGVVLEGRDTGTVVCPDAEVKVFLTASLDCRVRRRHAELAAEGRAVDLAALRAEVETRDAQDTTRALAPLVKAPDAIEVDTTDLTIDEVVERLAQAVERRRPGAAEGPTADDAAWRLYAWLKPLAVALFRGYWRLEARGRERVPTRGPLILVSNHSSVIDPPLIGAAAPRRLTFLAKAELFRIPVFGPFIRALGAHPLRREGSDPSALRTALRLVGEGQALLVFPEGTRGPEGVLRAAKSGAGMLAVSSGAPVVPVWISGTGRAWPRGARLPRPAKVVVSFGEPLRFERAQGAGKKARYEAASRAMMAAIARLRDEAIGEAGPVGSARSLQIH
jgi:cytidylate kinase